MICLVRILDETVSDIYNVDVGLLATVNNVFAKEESTVIMISDITMEFEEYE